MKYLRKLAGLMLALTMTFSLAAAAFAAEEGTLSGGSITIRDAVPGQIYRIYQILYLESYNKDSDAYAYKANSAWAEWLKTQTGYLHFDDQGYVSWVEGADPAAFAKLAQAEAAARTADASATAPAASKGETYSTVKFENLKLGYYLVDTTLGTLCALDTTNPDVVMKEKNEVPVNVKTVQEDSTGSYGSENDADIGQTVSFQSAITAQTGAENYVFHDAMSAGLTYTGITGITLNGRNVDASSYTITAPAADGDTFDVSFTQAFCDTLKANDQILIRYTAVLNEKAVIAGEGNPNAGHVSYGDSTNTSVTPDSQTKTYTWKVNVLKYTMEGNEEKPLAGAVFSLSRKADGTDVIALVSLPSNVYRVAGSGETGTVTRITTDDTGAFTIQGLDADTYYLTEVKQPDGYNRLPAPITVVIGQNGVVNATADAPQGVDAVKVENKAGTLLPSTGGAGTAIFYILGSLLTVGAGVLLVARKRTSGR